MRSGCKLVSFLYAPQGELDRERFSTDLKRTVETHTGYKAELRIFVSKGEIYFLVKILQGVLCKNASITCTRLTRFTRVRLLRAVCSWF